MVLDCVLHKRIAGVHMHGVECSVWMSFRLIIQLKYMYLYNSAMLVHICIHMYCMHSTAMSVMRCACPTVGVVGISLMRRISTTSPGETLDITSPSTSTCCI